MNARVELVIACLPCAMKAYGGGPEGAVYMANKILNTMADTLPKVDGETEPKATPQPDQAAEDEAWARSRRHWLTITADSYGREWWARLDGKRGLGPTIATAIRALREKVEGGAR